MSSIVLNNRYRVIQVLGSGGFGETFLAQDEYSPSKRYCVVKQLKLIVNNPQIYQIVQERFEREAAILEKLRHDQIPKLFAAFEEAGRFYLVQEYIEGQTLAEKFEAEGTLSEEAVKQILQAILPVLEYLHAHQIIHRDIKPENIILRQSDRQPVLIDFGAVKELMNTV